MKKEKRETELFSRLHSRSLHIHYKQILSWDQKVIMTVYYLIRMKEKYSGQRRNNKIHGCMLTLNPAILFFRPSLFLFSLTRWPAASDVTDTLKASLLSGRRKTTHSVPELWRQLEIRCLKHEAKWTVFLLSVKTYITEGWRADSQ